MRVDGERWPSNGIRRPGLRAFAVGQAKICVRSAYGHKARELGVGPIF